MEQRDVVTVVAQRAGGIPEEEAHAVLAVVTSAIGGASTERLGHQIADAVGEQRRRIEHVDARRAEDVHRIVATRLGVTMKRAAELTSIVGEVVGERLDDEGWALVERDLAPELATLLASAQRPSAPPVRHHARASMTNS